MSGAALGVLTFGSHVVSGQIHAQIHAVCGARSVIVLDRSSVPTVHRPHVLLFAGLSIVRIVPMAGFLKMVLQLFFGVASALTHRAHLLRRRRRMGVLVRAMIPYNLASILAHTKIVPLDTCLMEGTVERPNMHPGDTTREPALWSIHLGFGPSISLQGMRGTARRAADLSSLPSFPVWEGILG
jgi:hypothetical protein